MGEIDFRCQSSPLPYPPRPPTPPLLTGLVWVVTNALTQVEGWEKGVVQLMGREKSSFADSGSNKNKVHLYFCTPLTCKPLILCQRTQTMPSLDEWGGWEVSEGREGRRSGV